MTARLEATVRQARARIIAALAARFRDLDLAEEAFGEACLRAADRWRAERPERPDAWLFRTAERAALDIIRKRSVRARLQPDAPEPEPSIEDAMADDANLIPDERLQLIFVCCHPAVASESRAALTLRLVCGLSTQEIAHAILVPEPTLAQRLVRAKRKIAEAGVPFEIPAPTLWAERLDAVLSTLEIAYSKAHEDAAGAGRHAGYAEEMLSLSGTLAELLPDEPEVLAFAALVRFAEARRPARIDGEGRMVPLAEQDPALWRPLWIEQAHKLMQRACLAEMPSERILKAGIHAAWSTRKSLADPPPWRKVLGLYNALLAIRANDIVRLNRLVPLAEVQGVEAALTELESFTGKAFASFLPYQAVRADLLRRAARLEEASDAYDSALALEPPIAEAAWLRKQRDQLGSGGSPGAG